MLLWGRVGNGHYLHVGALHHLAHVEVAPVAHAYHAHPHEVFFYR